MHTASRQGVFNDKSNTSSRTRVGAVGSLMYILSSFSLFCFVTLGGSLGDTLGDTPGVANAVAPEGGDVAGDAGKGVSQGVA